MNVSRSMLSDYGGPATSTRHGPNLYYSVWGLLNAEVPPSVRFLLRILSHCEMNTVVMEDIPPDMVLKWDQRGIKTMEKS